MINQCKYCLTAYTNKHNVRLCYEYQYFIICSSIDDYKKILSKEYNKSEDLMLPEEHKQFEELKDRLLRLYDYEEELRLNPEPMLNYKSN